MSGLIVQVGEKATREMAQFGDKFAPEFDRAAADAARAAGFSDPEIIDMFGYLPSPPVPTETAETEAGH
jgi:hypothetical protein